MDLQLNGKKALIIGASRGLGYAVAQGLAQEGADLVITSRQPAGLDKAVGSLSKISKSRIIAVAGDITDPSFPATLLEKTVAELGGLDLLVTNAGGPPPGKFEDFDDQMWQRAIDLSLMSHVRVIRAALPHLRQSGSPSVLTITSYSVKQPVPNLVLSNSVRAATVGLTKTLALELGRDSIRFNSILPGWTVTERVTELMSARAKMNGTTIDEEIAKQAQDSPLGRLCQPHEFANVAVFLLSPAASYLTGVMLSVDGGMVKGTL